MRKKQKKTLIITGLLILLQYGYFFLVTWSYSHYLFGIGCGQLTHQPIAIPSSQSIYSPFFNNFMHCGLFDVFALTAVILQSLTKLPYIFLITVLPWIMWLPFGLIGTVVYYVFGKQK